MVELRTPGDELYYRIVVYLGWTPGPPQMTPTDREETPRVSIPESAGVYIKEDG